MIDEELSLISIGTRIFGIKNREKSVKRFPKKMTELLKKLKRFILRGTFGREVL